MALVKAYGFPMLTKTFQTLSLAPNRCLSTSSLLGVSVSPVILGMPTRSKRKVDPQEVRRKEERRKVRLTKALKKMGKKERLPKPLQEVQPSQLLLKERERRTRKVSILHMYSLIVDLLWTCVLELTQEVTTG